jgi:uncharacterized protein DUF6510
MEERIGLMRDDPAVELTVDGNAIGGVLASIFAVDVTASPGECATCHTVSIVGTMRVYMRGPGIVVRCPACAEVVVRIVETPTETLVDVSGVAMLRVPGSASPGS